MLLIGHLDTVFEPDSPFQRWERRGNDGIGPGSGDDKGGMAVMIAALRAMHAAGTEVLAEQAGAGYRRPLMRRLAALALEQLSVVSRQSSVDEGPGEPWPPASSDD